LLISQVYPIIILSLIIFRLTIWYLIIGKSAKLLQEKDLIIFAPLFEISLIFIQLYIFTKNIISQPKQW
ncbi:MAG: glycosyl transferase family 2, partial [Flavobacteriaceae bacterium]|nr:glycosyl transferase family 2 [Flavobacteriaceae bacterium]